MNYSERISKDEWLNVMKRTNFHCAYCGVKGSKDNQPLTLDHIYPKSLGGTEHPANLVASCRRCNLAKGNKTADDFRLFIDDINGSDKFFCEDGCRKRITVPGQKKKGLNEIYNSLVQGFGLPPESRTLEVLERLMNGETMIDLREYKSRGSYSSFMYKVRRYIVERSMNIYIKGDVLLKVGEA
jgi:molybdenum cofactor biosynthesis enzyme MoaA